jgi:hypothetical protein
MYAIYRKTRDVTLRSERYIFGSPSAAAENSGSSMNVVEGSSTTLQQQRSSATGKLLRTQRKESATQAFLYIGAYVITHQWNFVLYIIDMVGVPQPFGLVLLGNFFWPLQGFFNAFIFLRPRIRRIRQNLPDVRYATVVHEVLFHYDEYVEKRRGSSSQADRPSKSRLRNLGSNSQRLLSSENVKSRQPSTDVKSGIDSLGNDNDNDNDNEKEPTVDGMTNNPTASAAPGFSSWGAILEKSKEASGDQVPRSYRLQNAGPPCIDEEDIHSEKDQTLEGEATIKAGQYSNGRTAIRLSMSGTLETHELQQILATVSEEE